MQDVRISNKFQQETNEGQGTRSTGFSSSQASFKIRSRHYEFAGKGLPADSQVPLETTHPGSWA